MAAGFAPSLISFDSDPRGNAAVGRPRPLSRASFHPNTHAGATPFRRSKPLVASSLCLEERYIAGETLHAARGLAGPFDTGSRHRSTRLRMLMLEHSAQPVSGRSQVPRASVWLCQQHDQSAEVIPSTCKIFRQISEHRIRRRSAARSNDIDIRSRRFRRAATWTNATQPLLHGVSAPASGSDHRRWSAS